MAPAPDAVACELAKGHAVSRATAAAPSAATRRVACAPLGVVRPLTRANPAAGRRPEQLLDRELPEARRRRHPASTGRKGARRAVRRALLDPACAVLEPDQAAPAAVIDLQRRVLEAETVAEQQLGSRRIPRQSSPGATST